MFMENRFDILNVLDVLDVPDAPDTLNALIGLDVPDERDVPASSQTNEPSRMNRYCLPNIIVKSESATSFPASFRISTE